MRGTMEELSKLLQNKELVGLLIAVGGFLTAGGFMFAMAWEKTHASPQTPEEPAYPVRVPARQKPAEAVPVAQEEEIVDL